MESAIVLPPSWRRWQLLPALRALRVDSHGRHCADD